MSAEPRHADKRHNPATLENIRALQHAVETTGKPGHITSPTDACRDCTADGAFTLLPGGYVIGHIWHDEHCPAAARRRRLEAGAMTARPIEQWRPVPGYEDHYEISDHGAVRSLDRVTVDSLGRRHPVSARLLRPSRSGRGSVVVFLWRDGQRQCYPVQRLVDLVWQAAA